MPNTEADEGRYEQMRAYPEPPEMTRADLVAESEWWDWWWAEGRFQEADPHGWPREAEGPLLEALRVAVAEVAAVTAPCQECGEPVQGDGSACSHGKDICAECWPGKCWGCQADADEAMHYDDEGDR